MQPPNWTEFLHCCVCISKFDSKSFPPISLSCGHTFCSKCLAKLKTRLCLYDKNPIGALVETLPINFAILQLVEDIPGVRNGRYPDLGALGLAEADHAHYLDAMEALDKLARFLLPLADQSVTSTPTSHVTKPMLKKLVSMVTCQVLESEGRVRILRAARSIADRTVTELLVMHQNQQQLSTQLWTAVKNRGCQFLGPVMQEEALKLVLMVLQSGKLMARKTIVSYVVQKLTPDFPQASKTSVGHVVQLLYRASCFNVEKREDDSSLMQLKEEFRSYELLRREHDAQIIRMAMEAGLRISPEQWSTLLYGSHKHKSDMQSIIDKLISQGATSSGLNELIVAIGRSQDPYNLSEKAVPHLEVLLRSDVTNNEKCTKLANSWSSFSEYMHALHNALQGFSTFMQIQSGRFKTGLCPNISRPEGCPRGDKCTYAHTEEERDMYRSLSKSNKSAAKSRTEPIKLSGASSRLVSVTRGRHSGDFGPPLPDLPVYSFVPPTQQRDPVRFGRQGSGNDGSFDSGPLSGPYYPRENQLFGLPADSELGVVPQAAPTQPSQFYPPPGIGYSTTPQYHTIPIVTAPQQFVYNNPSRMVTANQQYYASQERGGGVGMTRPRSFSGEQPYQDTNYHSYITSPASSAYPSLTEQQFPDVARRDEDHSHTQEDNPYPEWSNYTRQDSYTNEKFDSDPQVPKTDPSSLEGSSPLSIYPQGYPKATTPTASSRGDDSLPIVTTSLEGPGADLELEKQMGNLKIVQSVPSSSDMGSYPLTTAVITSALSRSQAEFEPVHKHLSDSTTYSQMSDTHSTLSYSNPEFRYPPHTTMPQPLGSVTGTTDVRTVPSYQGINPIPSISRGTEDLRERKARLERELRQIELEEQQQQVAQRWSGPKPGHPSSRIPYEGGGGASPHHSVLIQQPYTGQLQYSPHGSLQGQYSPHSTMTHQYLAQQPSLRDYQHAVPGPSTVPQGGLYYTPQATPTPHPHQWSGPLNTPPNPGFVTPVHQPGYLIQSRPTAAPSAMMVQPPRLDPSADDGMLAAYLQNMEQEKAAFPAHSYTSPINHGSLGMYPPAPRQHYHGNFKYTY